MKDGIPVLTKARRSRRVIRANGRAGPYVVSDLALVRPVGPGAVDSPHIDRHQYAIAERHLPKHVRRRVRELRDRRGWSAHDLAQRLAIQGMRHISRSVRPTWR